jgi:hypothetical protein
MPRNDHDNALTTCSQCSARYEAAARFCSHCGADNLGSDADVGEESTVGTRVRYDVLLLGIPVAATLALWLWVGDQNLALAPQRSLLLISLINVLGTAVAACLEARAFNSRRHGGHHLDPPIWFALIALLWVLAYPLYLYRRKAYGIPSLLAAGITLSIIFSFSVAAVDYHIEERQQALQRLPTNIANAANAPDAANVLNASHAEVDIAAKQESPVQESPTQDPAIAEAIAAYRQARKYNSQIEICIKAKQVASLLRDANDLAHFRAWDATQRTECHAAGLLEQ